MERDAEIGVERGVEGREQRGVDVGMRVEKAVEKDVGVKRCAERAIKKERERMRSRRSMMNEEDEEHNE